MYMEPGFGKKETDGREYDLLLEVHRDIELKVLRELSTIVHNNGLDSMVLIHAMNNLSAQKIYEHCTLRDLIDVEERRAAENRDAERLETIEIIRAANLIAQLKIGLMGSHLTEEAKMLLKESAQIGIFEMSSNLNPEIYDILLDYLDKHSPDIVGVDLSDQDSIDAAKRSTEKI